MVSHNTKALLSVVAGLIILTAGGYFWYTYSGYITHDCAHYPSDKQDICCAAQGNGTIDFGCTDPWKFDRVLGKCAYECNLAASDENATNQTTEQPTHLFCTADAKQCPDGSYVSRDPQNNCEFKPCPIVS